MLIFVTVSVFLRICLRTAYLTLGGRHDLTDGIRDIPDDRSHFRHSDVATDQGILDAHHRGGDSSLHLTTLKGQIAVHHLAVNEPQLLAVTQGLGADDPAPLKGHILAVPCQILPLYSAVADHHILRVPEGVLGIEGAMLKHGVLDVLEGVLSPEGDIAEVQVSAPHHEVLALSGAVLHGHPAGIPSKLW